MFIVVYSDVNLFIVEVRVDIMGCYIGVLVVIVRLDCVVEGIVYEGVVDYIVYVFDCRNINILVFIGLAAVK